MSGDLYTIEEETLTEIADAIRSKTGESNIINTMEMAEKIRSISGGSNEEWISKAEYDALPDDKLTDGKNYYIYDWSESSESGGGSFNKFINYSLEEQDTGIKWIDGNNIYQKTFTTTYSTNKEIPLGFTIGTLINVNGSAKMSSNYWFPIQINWDNTQRINVILMPNKSTLMLGGNSIATGAPVIFTIQYTKEE